MLRQRSAHTYYADQKYVLATVTIGACITCQPSDNAAELVGAANTALRILADPLVDQSGLLVDECSRHPGIPRQINISTHVNNRDLPRIDIARAESIDANPLLA